MPERPTSLERKSLLTLPFACLTNLSPSLLCLYVYVVCTPMCVLLQMKPKVNGIHGWLWCLKLPTPLLTIPKKEAYLYMPLSLCVCLAYYLCIVCLSLSTTSCTWCVRSQNTHLGGKPIQILLVNNYRIPCNIVI